jgi:hypothetical protein
MEDHKIKPHFLNLYSHVEQMRYYQKLAGYKTGWINHQYEEFGI